MFGKRFGNQYELRTYSWWPEWCIRLRYYLSDYCHVFLNDYFKTLALDSYGGLATLKQLDIGWSLYPIKSSEFHYLPYHYS